jgi:NAD(P)-dependent dehydrogenase (short-subunit alcohol dehydrogenase family)
MEVRRFGIDVICIEPGLIRTEFGSTAAGGVSASDIGPYAEFNASVAKSTLEAYEGPLSHLGGDADTVARAIQRALDKPRAPSRVPVTASARLILGLRTILPDRAWDAVVTRAFS